MAKITERKRAEEALRESQERFRSAFEHAAIGMALVRPDGHLLQVNPSFCQMLGYSEKELTSTHWQAISHPDELETTQEHVNLALAGEIDSFQIEKRYFHKLGHEVWGLLSFSLVRAADGSPLYFISQIQDITKRKLAETALRESEERYRALYEEAPVAYLTVSTAGHILRANELAVALLGYVKDALVGRSIVDLHPDREHAQRVLGRFRAGEEIEDEEMEVRRADGSSAWVSLKVRVCRDSQGRVAEGRSMMIDISQRKRAEQALQAAREELEGRVDRQLLRRSNPHGLTFRELTVIHLIAAGRSDKQIGIELGISPLTAQKHVSNILAKMGAASRTEATARALREGLLE